MYKWGGQGRSCRNEECMCKKRTLCICKCVLFYFGGSKKTLCPQWQEDRRAIVISLDAIDVVSIFPFDGKCWFFSGLRASCVGLCICLIPGSVEFYWKNNLGIRWPRLLNDNGRGAARVCLEQVWSIHTQTYTIKTIFGQTRLSWNISLWI